jgi:hypothetical protein
MAEQIKKLEGMDELLEKGLRWLEDNEKFIKGISVWDEMDSSRPNINTLYIAYNGGSALVVIYHNGLGEEAGIDNIEITSAEKAKEYISGCIDPLPTVNTVDWLRKTLEDEKKRRENSVE